MHILPSPSSSLFFLSLLPLSLLQYRLLSNLYILCILQENEVMNIVYYFHLNRTVSIFFFFVLPLPSPPLLFFSLCFLFLIIYIDNIHIYK
jgi:hypothetical protein